VSDDLMMWLLNMVPLVALSIGLVLVYLYVARLEHRLREMETQLADVPRRFKPEPRLPDPYARPARRWGKA
jgi:cytochrome c-type biogenesis protein CcmH/NrfF